LSLVQQGWELVVGLVDRGGKVVNRTFELVATDTAGDGTDVFTDVGTIITRLVAVTEAKVKSYRVAAVYIEDALTLPTSAEAEVEQQLHLSALITGSPTESATYDIPAPKQANFQAASGPGADLPNFSVTALDNFVEIFNSAGANLATISDGESWDTNTLKGKKTHKHSTNG